MTYLVELLAVPSRFFWMRELAVRQFAQLLLVVLVLRVLGYLPEDAVRAVDQVRFQSASILGV